MYPKKQISNAIHRPATIPPTASSISMAKTKHSRKQTSIDLSQIILTANVYKEWVFDCTALMYTKNFLCVPSSRLDEFYSEGIHGVFLLRCVFVRVITRGWAMMSQNEISFCRMFFVPAGNSPSRSTWHLFVWKRCNHRGLFFSFLRDTRFWLLQHLLFPGRGSNAYYSPLICPAIIKSLEAALQLELTKEDAPSKTIMTNGIPCWYEHKYLFIYLFHIDFKCSGRPT